VIWDQLEQRNAILHNSENLVTQAEAVMIASRVQMEPETGIQGLLQGDRYLFDDHRAAKSVKWKVDSQISCLDTVSESRQSYNVSLTRLWGLFEGRGYE
jgi:regulator of sirC expression with transglutaminase-like and TPR domain